MPKSPVNEEKYECNSDSDNDIQKVNESIISKKSSKTSKSNVDKKPTEKNSDHNSFGLNNKKHSIGLSIEGSYNPFSKYYNKTIQNK